MPLLNDVMKEALRLVEECPMIATATCMDNIYKKFSNPPYLPAEDVDEGIWMSVNKELDGLFGSENSHENIRKGPDGMLLVIEWVNKAREHPTWYSPEDKAQNIQKKEFVQKSRYYVYQHSENLFQLILLNLNQMVLNPTPDPNVAVAKEPKPPPKRHNTLASTTILISSEDEEIVYVKSNNLSKKNKKPKESKRKDVITLCPLSAPNKPCICCKVERHPKGKAFSCHCGAAPVTLHQGRIEGAQAHWSSGLCKSATSSLRTNKLLSSYFVKDPALQPVNKNIIETICPGLTDETWSRPRAEQTISQFMDSTCSVYRGVNRHDVCKELFGPTVTENDVNKSQKAQLLAAMDARAIWEVKRHGKQNVIYSKKCEQTFKRHKDDPVRPCDSCLEVKEEGSLVRAVNHKYAVGDKLKFTPNYLLVANKYNALLRKFLDLKTLDKSLESSTGGDFGDFLEHLAIMARRGIFKNQEAVKGMIMGCAIRAEREKAGKSLRGMRINAHLNDCLTTLGAMSKSALKLVTKNFGGKTPTAGSGKEQDRDRRRNGSRKF
ncbi:uncharacterized protein MELLADRAFT_84980 [Melampsora larici-populina 98AG31]|uniref:Uncharacterized protein n=1 Tax=Melampsora larici-populina (strain 98AG31 / pathotype 3-4-7) TaxID=747676 RepID=F4RGT4_MELLP|nr:uncharacterized protein MELLADRAFT_84980 [Melampsora larici-populina 98AG31]EGG08193.1 hypothetical protein MELLADRAFT_84980 [Melampsora larici-populina 98AG31]